jgi:hypothetical protein
MVFVASGFIVLNELNWLVGKIDCHKQYCRAPRTPLAHFATTPIYDRGRKRHWGPIASAGILTKIGRRETNCSIFLEPGAWLGWTRINLSENSTEFGHAGKNTLERIGSRRICKGVTLRRCVRGGGLDMPEKDAHSIHKSKPSKMPLTLRRQRKCLCNRPFISEV